LILQRVEIIFQIMEWGWW